MIWETGKAFATSDVNLGSRNGETIVLFIFVLLIGFVSLCEVARSIGKLDRIFTVILYNKVL